MCCVYDKHHFPSISDSHDCQFWIINIVIFVHDYNNFKNSIFLCTKNRSELAIAYPDELGGTKMFQNENKSIPSGYTTATDKELTDN